MSGNDECPGGDKGDSSQFTNWISDSVATCHMTPEVSDFITGSLKIRINKLNLWTDTTSQRNKNVKYKKKCAAITH